MRLEFWRKVQTARVLPSSFTDALFNSLVGDTTPLSTFGNLRCVLVIALHLPPNSVFSNYDLVGVKYRSRNNGLSLEAVTILTCI